MQFKKFALVALVIPVVMLFAGCGNIAQKATEKAIENQTGVKVDTQGESVKIKTDKGEAVIGGSTDKVPDGFPSEFPVYDGAKVTGSMKTEAEGKKSFQVTFETSDAMAKVADFYKNSLPKSGYTISSTVEMGGATTLALKQGANDVGAVAISGEQGKTNIFISLSK